MYRNIQNLDKVPKEERDNLRYLVNIAGRKNITSGILWIEKTLW